MAFAERLNIILEREADDTDVIGSVVVLRKLPGQPVQVLLTKRQLPPAAGKWTLPGGHIKKGEKPLDGALRELLEETGIHCHKAVFVKNQRAAQGRGRIEFIFATHLLGAVSIDRGSDSRGLKWAEVSNLPALAFKHDDAIRDAALKLFNADALKEFYIPIATMIAEEIICEGVNEGKKLKNTVKHILDKEGRNDSGLLIVFEGIDGVGKCFAKDTPILMADGTIKLVQEIAVGDCVMGVDSTPRQVLSLGRGREMMYKIIPDHGDPYVVNESHILSLEISDERGSELLHDHQNRSGNIINISVRDYLRSSNELKQHTVGYRRPVKFQEKYVEIDPYRFGLYLSKNNAVGPQQFSNAESNCGDSIAKKRIPHVYKANSNHIRFELLAGLIDGCFKATLTPLFCHLPVADKLLAEDVVWVARSLGFAANVLEGAGYYVVTITGNVAAIPSRKPGWLTPSWLTGERCAGEDQLRTPITVEPVGVDDYYGFYISGDHLFLLGDFTVAHNSSQVDLLVDWLENQGYAVTTTKWNSSKLLKKVIDKAKDKRMLSPVLYCLLHAADMMVRYQEDIIPALQRNEIVVADRYWYTSAVRDQARGIDRVIADKVYGDIREPDLVFHCVCPIEVAFSRLLGDKGLSFYGSGMDLNLSPSKEENCIKYYNIMDGLYKKLMADVKNCVSLNMNRTIKQIAAEVQKIMANRFGIGKYTRR